MNPNSLANLKRGGPGRPRGVQNKATKEIRDAARAIVEDAGYVESLKRRVTAGKAPHMETLLFHYAYGKPAETVNLRVPVLPPPLLLLLHPGGIEDESK